MSTNTKDDSGILKGKPTRGFTTINNNKTNNRPPKITETTGTIIMNLKNQIKESEEVENIRRATQTSIIVIALIVALTMLFTRTYFENLSFEQGPNQPESVEYSNHIEK